jgi:alcohol dehydrogenase
MTSVELPEPGRSAAPTVAYGMGAIEETPRIAEQLGATRVLLVCGRTSFEASGAADMLSALERVADVHRWSDFQPNTDSADLKVGLGVLREHQPDLVLGIGGGSALDMAKLLVSFTEVEPEDVVANIEGGYKATSRPVRLVLAPTTSGSGAEATHFSVVYVGDDKHSIGGPAMRADAIVLDPSLTLSGSAYQRATSGIDAVAQAIESLWAVGATDRSRRFARHALRLLLPAIETYVNEPDESSARAMAIGSHLAGRAIDISKTTAAHALSYGITKRYGISHGHAVALTLGAFIEAHANAPSSRLQPGVEPTLHHAAVATVRRSLRSSDAADARERFTRLVEGIGLTSNLDDIAAITSADIGSLAGRVNPERLSNNPVIFDGPTIGALLESCR